jgi:hypothetical protein
LSMVGDRKRIASTNVPEARVQDEEQGKAPSIVVDL